MGFVAGEIDTCGRADAAIAMLAGAPGFAEQPLRTACAYWEALHNAPVLATRGGELAAVLYELGRYDEAAEWIQVASDSAGDDDLDAALTRKPVEAKLLARQGDAASGERLARETVSLAERTDALNRHADALLALAEVLELTGPEGAGREQVLQALGLYERKGNVAAARLAQRRLPTAGAAP
jgi:tetratricopeptide (TPR) repeat protein